MNFPRSLPQAALALALAVTCHAASAQRAQSGPGAMRCTVVIGRLASQDMAVRMAVVSWVQGYLSGAVATRAAAERVSAVEVPEYDALPPKILTQCRANPSGDLYEAARGIMAQPGR